MTNFISYTILFLDQYWFGPWADMTLNQTSTKNLFFLGQRWPSKAVQVSLCITAVPPKPMKPILQTGLLCKYVIMSMFYVLDYKYSKACVKIAT